LNLSQLFSTELYLTQLCNDQNMTKFASLPILPVPMGCFTGIMLVLSLFILSYFSVFMNY